VSRAVDSVRTSSFNPFSITYSDTRFDGGLYFTHQALHNMKSDTSASLHICFQRSYDTVLKRHHNFVARGVVSVALLSVPTRPSIYDRISQRGSHAKLDTELAKWLLGLDGIVMRERKFLEEGGYGKVDERRSRVNRRMAGLCFEGMGRRYRLVRVGCLGTVFARVIPLLYLTGIHPR